MLRLQVLPFPTVDDGLDCGWLHAKFGRKSFLGDPALRIAATDLQHVGISQLGGPHALTLDMTATGHGVAPIVLPCPKGEVVDADAGRVVAAVQDLQAVSNRPVYQLPRQAMDEDGALSNPDPAVAVRVAHSRPLRAPIGGVAQAYPRPQAGFRGSHEAGYRTVPLRAADAFERSTACWADQHGRLLGHRRGPSGGVTPPAVISSAGVSCRMKYTG